MNRKTILTLSAFLLLFCSCSHLYEPALYRQNIAYMPKPASFDSVKTATYVSVGYNYYSNAHYDDFFHSGQVDLGRGYVFNNFNLALGAFGVLGEYQNEDLNKKEPNYFSNTFFGGYGGRASADFFENSGNADFRIIGIEMAYSHEFGAYANDLKYLDTQPHYFVDPRTDLFVIGLTTEVIFHSIRNPNIQHGFRYFLGTTLGQNELDNSFYKYSNPAAKIFHEFFPRITYFFKLKNYFGIVETGGLNMLPSIRVGYKF